MRVIIHIYLTHLYSILLQGPIDLVLETNLIERQFYQGSASRGTRTKLHLVTKISKQLVKAECGVIY